MKSSKRSSLIILILIVTMLVFLLGCGVGEDNTMTDDTAEMIEQVLKEGGYSSGHHVAADYYLWDIKHFFGLKNDDLTQEDCEKWMTLWKEEKLFWAVNVPDASDVYMDAHNLAMMKLFSFEMGNSGTIGQINLQKTTAHQDWIAQNLPQKTGTHWVALTGNSATASACREGTVAKGQWKAQIGYLLDFGGGKDDGRDAPTREYYCYQGQDAPFFFPENQAAWALFKLRASQDDAITCMGPVDTTIAQEDSDWYVAHTPVWYYDEPSPIKARYHIYKPEETYTIQWTIDSDVGTGWKLVFGNETGPYEPEQIVSNPFPATMTDFYVWALADMPANTADGSYVTTVTFTATSPENVKQATHANRSLVWVGDWTPSGDSETKIYMPMLLN